MPISYAAARRAGQRASALLADGYTSSVIVAILQSEYGASAVEGNRIYARSFECASIQSRIRAGGFAGLVDPRHPLTPSNPESSAPNEVAIVWTAKKEQSGSDTRYYSFVARGIAPDNYGTWRLQMDTMLAALVARYSLADITLLDPAKYIY